MPRHEQRLRPGVGTPCPAMGRWPEHGAAATAGAIAPTESEQARYAGPDVYVCPRSVVSPDRGGSRSPRGPVLRRYSGGAATCPAAGLSTRSWELCDGKDQGNWHKWRMDVAVWPVTP